MVFFSKISNWFAMGMLNPYYGMESFYGDDYLVSLRSPDYRRKLFVSWLILILDVLVEIFSKI